MLKFREGVKVLSCTMRNDSRFRIRATLDGSCHGFFPLMLGSKYQNFRNHARDLRKGAARSNLVILKDTRRRLVRGSSCDDLESALKPFEENFRDV